jgi:hypothetical protein
MEAIYYYALSIFLQNFLGFSNKEARKNSETKRSTDTPSVRKKRATKAQEIRIGYVRCDELIAIKF